MASCREVQNVSDVCKNQSFFVIMIFTKKNITKRLGGLDSFKKRTDLFKLDVQRQFATMIKSMVKPVENEPP